MSNDMMCFPAAFFYKNMKQELYEKLKSFKNQKQWKDYVQDQLDNDAVVVWVLRMLYNEQTNDEKRACESVEENGAGFNKYDARWLTKLARKVINREPVTVVEFAAVRLRLKHYWKQVMKKLKVLLEQAGNEPLQSVENCNDDYEQMELCYTEGKACDFGICSECKGCKA